MKELSLSIKEDAQDDLSFFIKLIKQMREINLDENGFNLTNNQKLKINNVAKFIKNHNWSENDCSVIAFEIMYHKNYYLSLVLSDDKKWNDIKNFISNKNMSKNALSKRQLDILKNPQSYFNADKHTFEKYIKEDVENLCFLDVSLVIDFATFNNVDINEINIKTSDLEKLASWVFSRWARDPKEYSLYKFPLNNLINMAVKNINSDNLHEIVKESIDSNNYLFYGKRENDLVNLYNEFKSFEDKALLHNKIKDKKSLSPVSSRKF